MVRNGVRERSEESNMSERWRLLDSASERTLASALVLALQACSVAVLSAEEIKPNESGALPEDFHPECAGA